MKCSEPIRASSKKEIELPIALGLEHKWRNLIPRREVNSLGFSLIGGKVRRWGSTDVRSTAKLIGFVAFGQPASKHPGHERQGAVFHPPRASFLRSVRTTGSDDCAFGWLARTSAYRRGRPCVLSAGDQEPRAPRRWDYPGNRAYPQSNVCHSLRP